MGTFDNCLGEFWTGGGFVPVVECFQVVANDLFVEAGGGGADYILGSVPVAGRVGGEDFVYKIDGSVFVGSEFEFGVSEDDACFGGEFVAEVVEFEADGFDLVEDVLADYFGGFFSGYWHVMAFARFGGRSEDGLGEL